MTFQVFFFHLYSLLQIYILSFRRTVRLRALLYLVMVGAIASAPAAIAGQYLKAAYFSSSTWYQSLLAAMEELAKAAPGRMPESSKSGLTRNN
jgi:hypothetical protein